MGGEKELSTLVITMISAMDDVYLLVSLSGDRSKPKQSHPVRKHGSTNPWFGHTFDFPVDEAVAPSCYLKFKIEKADRAWLHKDVCEVDVLVRDLLVKAGPGDAKPKVLSYEVRSSSGETEGVLQFYCELVPPPTKKADEPTAGYQAVRAPPTSNLAATYSPTVPRAVPPSLLPLPSGCALGAYPSAGYLQPTYPSARYPPVHIPQATWGYRPNATPNCGYLPPAGYPAPAVLPATCPAPMPGAAPYLQTVYTPNAAPNYPLQGYMNPPVGYKYAAPLPHVRQNFMQTAYLLNAAPTYGYPPLANMHPPAGHGLIAPMLHAGGNFLERVTSRITADVILNGFIDPGNNDGIFPMPDFDM